jgi:hydrogenase nickel incorporation protein HypA/HybF
MHELSIAMAIVEMAVEEAERRNSGRIQAIHLKIGKLSGVVPEALRSSFELAREETLAAHARLVIEEVPIIVHCSACNAERTPEFPGFDCPICGTPTPDILRGRELEVFALELESS